MESGLALLALLVAAYALVAARLQRLSISPALAFVLIGILLSEDFLGILALDLEAESVKVVAEITLALVLFGDASSVDLSRLSRDAGLVARLLVPGLLLTIGLGTVIALGLFPGITVGLGLLIAASLAPTDAALGQAVITDRQVPTRIRRILNVESGLNDGIATPFVLLAIGLATAEATGSDGWITDAMYAGAIGAAAGIVVGAAGGWLLVAADLPQVDLTGISPARRPGSGDRLIPRRCGIERQRVHRGVRGRTRVRRRDPQTRRERATAHRGTRLGARDRLVDRVRHHGRRCADRRRP